MKKITILFCAILALVSQGVFAKQNPKGLVTDRRIKVVWRRQESDVRSQDIRHVEFWVRHAHLARTHGGGSRVGRQGRQRRDEFASFPRQRDY